MAKRRKLKKQVYFVLIGIVLFIGLIIFGINRYNLYKYHQTNEYKLLEIGYSEEEVNEILKFDEDTITYFLNNEKNTKIIDLLNEEYYLDKNFDKYISYMNEYHDLSTTEVVRNINIHLDKDFYEETYPADTSLDTSILVNKYYYLSEDFAPTDLVTVSQTYSWGEAGSKRVREVVYSAFLDMWNAANSEGYYLMINSSYRTYQDQESVYNNYRNTSGQTYADSIAARPGFSEHQTGLVIDMTSKTAPSGSEFAASDEYKWLKEHAYEFGFIERYPEGKTYITGYSPESWHWRYVGVEAATTMQKEGITYDEYYAFYIEK